MGENLCTNRFRYMFRLRHAKKLRKHRALDLLCSACGHNSSDHRDDEDGENGWACTQCLYILDHDGTNRTRSSMQGIPVKGRAFLQIAPIGKHR